MIIVSTRTFNQWTFHNSATYSAGYSATNIGCLIVLVIAVVFTFVCLRRRRTLKPKPAEEGKRGIWAEKVCGG